LAGRLEHEGVHATVVGANLAAIVGAGNNLLLPCRVLVPTHQLDDARALVAVLEEVDLHPRPEEPKLCPGCGVVWEPGFDVCWSCQRALG